MLTQKSSEFIVRPDGDNGALTATFPTTMLDAVPPKLVVTRVAVIVLS